MKNHGFNDSQYDDAPPSIEKDDEKLMDMMDLQDPMGMESYGPEAPKTIEEKYEAEITYEKVIQPMLEDIFGGDPTDPTEPALEEPDAE